MLACYRECLFAVTRVQHFIAVRFQPRRQDVAICLIVVGDENARWVVHLVVTRGLDPRIHLSLLGWPYKRLCTIVDAAWTVGTSPAMTRKGACFRFYLPPYSREKFPDLR